MKRSPCTRIVLAVWLVAATGPALAAAQSRPDPAPDPPPQTAVAPCDQHGVSTVFRCIWHDVRHIARPDSLKVLIAGGVLSAGSVLLDDEVVKSMKSDHQDLAVAVGDNLGAAGVQFGAAAGLYAIGRATRYSDVASLGVTLLRAQVVNGVLTRGLKFIPRPRPYQEVATTGKGSFPSGHTSASFATATVLQRRWGWHGGAPAYALATFIGVTRLQSVHYLSDVTFGAAVGIASGLTVNTGAGRVSVAPIVTPGATGVTVEIR